MRNDKPLTPSDRARGCMAGLALGDAIGRPAEGMSAAQILEKWGRISGFVVNDPAGSDDTEYALLTAETLYRKGSQATRFDFAETWATDVVPQADEFQGAGFSEMAAIDNLRRGIPPPLSGDTVHGWSDGLAMRVAPIGIVSSGNPQLAAELAIEDGTVSHSAEGIHAGVAVAVAVAVAMAGATAEEAYAAAVAAIPADSWTARNLATARRLVEGIPDPDELALALNEELVAGQYFWADLAPEAVGLAFAALLHGRGVFTDSMLYAVNLGRDADTNAAIAGCIAGAISGISSFPDSWVQGLQPVAGSCIHTMAGKHPIDCADRLVTLIQGVSA